MEINTQSNVPRWIWLTLGGLAIVFLGLTIIDKGYSVSKNFSDSIPENTISMTGEGKVNAKPDIATVTVGIVTTASTAKTAQDDNTASMNKINAAVKALGIDEKDLTTSNFSVYPNYNYDNGKNTITGYTANQNLTIKVRGVDKSTDTLGKVLDGALVSGSNQIQGVYFGFDDADNLRQQARKIAIEKAKQKAQDLADASGIKLGKVVSISESSISSPYPVMYNSAKDLGIGGAGGGTPSIEAGSQDITATMTVIFELK